MSGRISRVIRQTLDKAEGARIAVIFGNVPEWIASFVAVTSIGATAVAVHRASSLRDMVAALDMTDCGMVICDDEVAAALSGEASGRPAVAIGPAGNAIGAAHPLEPTEDTGRLSELTFARNDSVAPEHVAMIAFTSGSTSRPKGVELTHRSMTCGMMNALLGGALASAGARDRMQNVKHLPPTPFLASAFSHVSGYGTALLSMYVGSRILTTEKWDPKGAVECMLSQRATSLIGVTSQMLLELLQQGELAALGDFMRSLVVQGTALPPSLLRELKLSLPQVSIGAGYGLTETNGSVCMGSEAMLQDRPNTSGRPLPSVDLEIRRADGNEAGPGEIGEVLVRGAMLMRGYVNRPDATNRALQDGWFRTGDLGLIDADGFLYLTDRAEHFVVCGGGKVSCSAVAQVILDNKLAAEAFAFGVDDEGQEQTLVLAVSCPEEASADDAALIEALRLAGYGSLAPRVVRLRTSLPKTPSGKIDGHELRRQILTSVED
jgi:acyl-CoA synthetase (AMP-forming)/AMP-acid ligase II